MKITSGTLKLQERVRAAENDRETYKLLVELHDHLLGGFQDDWSPRFFTIAQAGAYRDAALELTLRLYPKFDYVLEHTNGGLTIRCQLGPEVDAFGETDALAILGALLAVVIDDARSGRQMISTRRQSA